MDYQHYEVEDLAKDGYFRKSVLSPDDASRRFWASWTASSAANADKYEHARLLVIAVYEKYEQPIADEEISRRIERMEQHERLAGATGSDGKGRWGAPWRFVAAAGVALLAVSVWWLGRDDVAEGASDMVATTTSVEAEMVTVHEVVRENSSKSNLTLMLDDSTVVTLLPGSKLKFPSAFDKSTREVELVGDAFFDVTPNPHVPFMVYAGETIVKVLGTSFRVTAHEKSERVTVKVLSGRVSVFSRADFSGNARASEILQEGVLLTPNQEVVLNKSLKTVETSTVASRAEEAREEQYRELIFDDTPIANVFREFEKTYGMEIEFDQDSFRKCPITTYFKEESLLERINTICQAVGATYRPENGKIIVTGIDCTGYDVN